jgi:hypothetical protein
MTFLMQCGPGVSDGGADAHGEEADAGGRSSGRARVEYVASSILGLTATILGTYGVVRGRSMDFGRTDEFPLREAIFSGDDRFGRG